MNVSTKNDTTKDTLFELRQIEIQYTKNYFKISFFQEAGATENNIGKEPQKSRQKLRKYRYEIFTANICSACNPMQVVAF